MGHQRALQEKIRYLDMATIAGIDLGAQEEVEELRRLMRAAGHHDAAVLALIWLTEGMFKFRFAGENELELPVHELLTARFLIEHLEALVAMEDPQNFWKLFLPGNHGREHIGTLPGDFGKAHAAVLHQGIQTAQDQLPTPSLIQRSWRTAARIERGEPHHPLIIVDGVMGSGTTTLVQALAEVGSAKYSEEEWKGNLENLIPFYNILKQIVAEGLLEKALEGQWDDRIAQMHERQYKVQTWFANNTTRRTLRLIGHLEQGPAILNVSTAGDAAYVLTHFAMGLASPQRFLQYAQESQLRQAVIPPVPVVVVQNKVRKLETLKERIFNIRSRDFEGGIPPGYIEALWENSQAMIAFMASCGVPIVEVDAETLDFSQANPARLDLAAKVWEQILQVSQPQDAKGY